MPTVIFDSITEPLHLEVEQRSGQLCEVHASVGAARYSVGRHTLEAFDAVSAGRTVAFVGTGAVVGLSRRGDVIVAHLWPLREGTVFSAGVEILAELRGSLRCAQDPQAHPFEL